MKKVLFFLVVFIVGLFSVYAADVITLKDGNVIEAKIMEMHPNEIRYKRANNLNGPMFFLPKNEVLSIKYENGTVDIINASPSAGQQSGQTAGAGSSGGQQAVAQTPAAQTPGVQTSIQASLQNTLNGLPAIKIAGNNLKFQFAGENWTATLNGANFSAGTIEVEDTNGGSLLNLKQTHMWPGAAAGKLTGKLSSKVPGGGAALNAAGSLAGAVETSGPILVLEYKAGPPAKLAYLRSTAVQATSQTASVQTSASTPENTDSISGKRYEVVEQAMTWAKAKAEAEKRGGHLAVITSAEEQETIANMIATGKKGGYWLGGSFASRWKWVNDEPMDYTNWGPGYPRTSNGNVRIVMMRTSWGGTGVKLGHWGDGLKDTKGLGYIIEYPGTASVATAPSVQPAPTPVPAVQPAPIPVAAQAPVNPAPTPAAVSPSAGQQAVAQTPVAQASAAQTPGVQTSLQASLQNTLNGLPAITIAGNNLKFQFSGANWTALLNGENFSTGTIEVEDTNGGALLTLKQTHIWPGAVAGKAAGKLGGKLAGKVPGGSAVAGAAVDAAGKAVGAVEASGPAMVLEYKAGPPAKLAYLRSTTVQATSQTASVPASASTPENTDSISGKRYEVVEKTMTWAKAKADAEKRGGYLAVITSAEEQETIANMIATGTKIAYWLGGSGGSRWKWVNDEPMNYTNWGPGHPGSRDGNVRIIMMRTPWGSTGVKLGHWAETFKDGKGVGYIIQWDE